MIVFLIFKDTISFSADKMIFQMKSYFSNCVTLKYLFDFVYIYIYFNYVCFLHELEIIEII